MTEDDDRIDCITCTHSVNFRCTKLHVSIADLPIRCPEFVPTKDEADQRTGRERWPDYVRQLAITRAEDASLRGKSK